MDNHGPQTQNQARWTVALLIVLIALSRVPFLNAGYGVENDAWRVARVARSISQTGTYEVSRFPGYPMHEIVSSWFWEGGPAALNALSALLGLVACFAAWQVARRLQARDALLLVAALAATPVFFVSSVTTKDYVWALAFTWLAMWMAIENRPLLAGVILGFGVGCRITTGAMLFPILLVLLGAVSEPGRWRALAKFAGATVCSAAVLFIPVWSRYGWEFFTFYNHGRPDAGTIIRLGTWQVWGSLGLVGLALGLGATLLRLRLPLRTSIEPTTNRMIVPALWLTVALYVLAYLRLPDQAGYLLPIVPATLFLLGRYTPRVAFQACCVCIIVSPFLELSSTGVQPGAILADHQARKQMIGAIAQFVRFTEANLPGENLVVVAGWEPMISVLSPAGATRNHYVYLATEADVQQAQAAGWGIAYASPSTRQYNHKVKAVDLAEYGAKDLHQLAQTGSAQLR